MRYRGVERVDWVNWQCHDGKYFRFRGLTPLPHFAILKNTHGEDYLFCVDGSNVPEEKFQIEIRKMRLKDLV
jgi:hypothetical protein